MFSMNPRCRYGTNQLVEVICQLRFPEILTISANPPAEFQDAIREEYPRFFRRQEAPLPVAGMSNNQAANVNYQFSTADGVWRVNLTSRFISLSCTSYTCWEDFAAHLDKPLAAFISIYKPAYFERMGLRYVNAISRMELGLEGRRFAEMIEPCYLGPLAEPEISEINTSKCTIDLETAIRGGCRLKLHAGPGFVRKFGKEDKEVKFILDLDLFMAGQMPVHLSAGVLQTLHSQAYPIFRGAVTDLVHHAMDPESI